MGSTLTRAELLQLALMSSENRAASALARNYPGGLQAFVAAANRKAAAIGMRDSVFMDGTGLSSSNVSTARDLAVMVAQAAAHYPLISEYSTASDLSVRTAHGARSIPHDQPDGRQFGVGPFPAEDRLHQRIRQLPRHARQGGWQVR